MSIVIPVRNEVDFIRDLLGDLLDQDYPPSRTELIISDGLSDDGTREIVDSFAGEIRASEIDRPAVVVLTNEARFVATGLNDAIRASTGEIVIRVDGHCRLGTAFISENVRLLEEHPEAWCVGGPMVHVGRTSFGKAVAIAMGHRLGVGNATHRFAGYEGYVEGAQFPAFRRFVFDKVGFFDERFVRNQDDEFNYRVFLAGGVVFVSPRVKYQYFVRERPARLFRQYFQYGFWRVRFLIKHGRLISWRQLVPPAFVLTVPALFAVGVVFGSPFVAMAVPAAYLLSLLVASALLLRREEPVPAVLMPVAAALMLTGYGLGFLFGQVARLLAGDPWEPGAVATKLSR